MKATKRILRLMAKYPKVFLAILVIGFVVHLVGPQCLVTSDKTDEKVQSTRIAIYGNNPTPANNGQWVNTGIAVTLEDRLSLTTTGTIYLCHLEEKSTTWSVNARNWDWVDTGISVVPGDKLEISSGAPNWHGKSNLNHCNGDKAPADNMVAVSDGNGSESIGHKGNCYQDNAYGLVGLIQATTPPSTNIAGQTSLSLGNGWAGNTSTAVTTYGGYDGYINATGTVFLNFGDNPKSDNRGGYSGTIKVIPQSGCPAEQGKPATITGFTNYGALQAVITTATPTPVTTPNLPLTNGQYNPQDTGQYAPASGTIWVRMQDADYTDNSGHYIISIHAARPKAQKEILSGMIVDLFINPVKNTLDRTIHPIFSQITQQVPFIKMIRAALLIYVILYATMFTLGLLNINQLDLVIRIAKIGVMLALISPNSWQFFNQYLLSVYMKGGMWLLNNVTGAVGTSDNPFRFLDKTLGIMIREDTILKLLALALVIPIGLIYLLLIMGSIWIYVCAIFRTIMGFMMSFIGVAVLLTMAPFFISFILFQDTKELFTKWLSLLFRYTLEPVIAILGITIINEMIVIAFHGIIDMSVCWKCAIAFTIPGYGNLFCLEFWMPWGFDNDGSGYDLSSMIFLFANVVIFEMLTTLLSDYINFVPRVAARLTMTSPVSGTNFVGSGSVGATAEKSLEDTAKWAVAQDPKSLQKAARAKGIRKKARENLKAEAASEAAEKAELDTDSISTET